MNMYVFDIINKIYRIVDNEMLEEHIRDIDDYKKYVRSYSRLTSALHDWQSWEDIRMLFDSSQMKMFEEFEISTEMLEGISSLAQELNKCDREKDLVGILESINSSCLICDVMSRESNRLMQILRKPEI